MLAAGHRDWQYDSAQQQQPRLTELITGKGQAGGVLIQVLVEVDAQVTQLLLDGFDLLLRVWAQMI